MSVSTQFKCTVLAIIATSLCGVTRPVAAQSSLGLFGPSNYLADQIQIIEAKLIEDDKVKITFRAMAETLYFCPGANSEIRDERIELTFVRASLNRKPKVTIPAKAIAGSGNQFIIVNAQKKPIFIRSPETRLKIFPNIVEADSPRAVVVRWLELHRTGRRDEASALTTGSVDHRADVLLPSKRDTGLRVERSLGNQQAAAVITNSLKEGGEEVLLFWLVRRDGVWRINHSDTVERRVVDERLRGFLEAGGVRWHLHRDALLGHWEAGPCRPPGVGGIACGSRLQLSDDNHYRLVAWGPGGPDPEYDDVVQGSWRLADGSILLAHQDRIHECRVAWLADNRLVIESPDGKGRAEYRRTDTAQRSDRAEARKE